MLEHQTLDSGSVDAKFYTELSYADQHITMCLNDSSDCRVLLRNAMTWCVAQRGTCSVEERLHMCCHIITPMS